jgi:hypothetical protein
MVSEDYIVKFNQGAIKTWSRMRIKANSPPPDIFVVDCLFYIGLTLQEKQRKDIGTRRKSK